MITTEQAEQLAQTHDLVRFTLGMKAPEHDLTAAALRSLAAERDALKAEVERLKAGGCARDQSTTQFCAEAAALQAENARLREALILARIAVSHACDLSDRILYTQDLRRIDAALGEKE
jgi:cell division protein FtsB